MRASFLKRVITTGLAVSSLFAMLSTTTVFADDSDKNISNEVVGKEEISNDTLRFYTTDSTKENSGSLSVVGADYIPCNKIRFYSDLSDPNSGFFGTIGADSEKENTINFSDCYDKPLDLTLPITEKYHLTWGIRWKTNNASIFNKRRFHSYEDTGGLYKKVKVKLSEVDADNYFLIDGSHISTIFDDTHKYNFTDEGNGYISLLAIDSGGAITRTHPDKDGNVEFYVHCKIGSVPEWHTFYVTKTNASSGGWEDKMYALTKGNVDLDNNISITDVTEIQRYLASIKDLSDMSKFNADVNNDDAVSIFDATEIQKYLARY